MLFAQITVTLALIALLLIPLHICGKINANRTNFDDNFVSAVAGVLAGYVFFVAYALWQTDTDNALHVFIDSAARDKTYSVVLQLLSFILGLVSGLSFLYFVHEFIPSRYTGMLNLVITLTSTVSLLNFFVQYESRAFIGYFTIAFCGGVLIYIILNPKPLMELFGEKVGERLAKRTAPPHAQTAEKCKHCPHRRKVLPREYGLKFWVIFTKLRHRR